MSSETFTVDEKLNGEIAYLNIKRYVNEPSFEGDFESLMRNIVQVLSVETNPQLYKKKLQKIFHFLVFYEEQYVEIRRNLDNDTTVVIEYLLMIIRIISDKNHPLLTKDLEYAKSCITTGNKERYSEILQCIYSFYLEIYIYKTI